MYPNSNSTLKPNISSGQSTSIIIKVNNTTVGAVQTLTITQNRELCRWEEIGTEGVIEIHPKNATKIDIQVGRIVFDDLRLLEAFGRGFINLQSQRVPFDIHILNIGVGGEDNILSTICHNCWITTYSTPYTASDFTITESATIWSEYITSMRNAQNASYGGMRGILFDYDTIERSTDLTGKRGRFTSSGIAK